jgi:ribosome-associated protein
MDAPKQPKQVDAQGEYIKLEQFLKLANVVESGGQAKVLIQAGQVKVNGEIETRRGRKLHQGDAVEFDGDVMVVEVE